MISIKLRPYLFSCLLLMVPVLLWNILLANSLPAAYQPEIFLVGIPNWLLFGENATRFVLFMLTALMPLSFKADTKRWGIGLYLLGLLLYFGSWLLLIYFPDSAWANSWVGFAAPAYTPLFWLLGIACIGDRFYMDLPYARTIFIFLSIIFLGLHNWHTFLVFLDIYG